MLSQTQVQAGGGGRGDDDVLVRLPPDLREVLDLQVRRTKKQHNKRAKNSKRSCSGLSSYNSSESGGSNNGNSSIGSRSCTGNSSSSKKQQRVGTTAAAQLLLWAAAAATVVTEHWQQQQQQHFSVTVKAVGKNSCSNIMYNTNSSSSKISIIWFHFLMNILQFRNRTTAPACTPPSWASPPIPRRWTAGEGGSCRARRRECSRRRRRWYVRWHISGTLFFEKSQNFGSKIAICQIKKFLLNKVSKFSRNRKSKIITILAIYW